MTALDDLLSLTMVRRAWFGREGLPVAGTNIGSTLAFRQVVPANGLVTAVDMYAGSVSGTLQIRRYSRNGDVFTQVGTALSLSVTANQLNSFTGLSWEVKAGEYLASYAPSGVRCYNTTNEDNPGWHYGAGDASSFTSASPSTANRIELRIAVDHIALTEAAQRLSKAERPADGFDHILREFVDADGRVSGVIGLQNADDQDPQAQFYRTYARRHESSFELTSYQYGGTIRGHGQFGDTIELQLGSDTDPSRKPWLSVRDREGRAGYGSAIQTRAGSDLWGFGISSQDEAFPFIGTFEEGETVPATLWLDHSLAAGGWGFSVQRAEVARFDARGFQFRARETAPEPDADSYIVWQREDGSEDAGDLMATINSGGVVRTARLVDFSALETEE